MVVFICNACGDTLKKNVVAKHGFKCRTSQGVSCIDCNKTFGGDDYSLHLSCKTENEKYGGSAYVQKEFKGKKKQDEWNENIANFINKTTNIDPPLKAVLQKIVLFQNIPRKETKFKNLLTNSMRVDRKIAEDVWKIVHGILTQVKNAAAAAEEKPKTPLTTNGKQEQTSKKRKGAAEAEAEGGAASKKAKKGGGGGGGEKMEVDNSPQEKAADKKKKKGKKGGDKAGQENETKGAPSKDNNDISDGTPKKNKKKNKKNKSAKENEETKEDVKLVENGHTEKSVSPEKKKKRGKKPNRGSNDTKAEAAAAATNKRKPGLEEAQTTPQKKKKKTTTSEEEASSAPSPTWNGTTPGSSSEFKWKNCIKKALKETPEGKMKMKKLEKTVLEEYFAASSQGGAPEEDPDQVREVFRNSLHTNKFVIQDNFVKIKV